MKKKTPTLCSVPRGTDDIVGAMIAMGIPATTIAEAWKMTPDAVYKLRRGEFVPRVTGSARLIAESIGWGVGRVVEHFAKRYKGART